MKRLLLSLLVAVVTLTAAHAIRITHGPYLQNVGPTEATIVWLADTTSIGWVEVFADDGSSPYLAQAPRYYDTAHGVKREGRIHSVVLRGLKPGTRYRYRVFAQSVLFHQGWRVHYGDIAATAAWGVPLPAFATLNPDGAEASFLVVNDIHERNDVLRQLLKLGGAKQKDLVFFNGDMISLYDSEQRMFRGFMDTAVREFASTVPLYYVRGNHEMRGNMAAYFHNYVCPRKERLYFTLRQGPVFFICLDTGEDKPDGDLEYSGTTDYDNYRTEQAEWLRGVVQSDEFRRAPYKVVVAHIPPYDKDGDVWHGDDEVARKFVPLLNGRGINLMLCGHKHVYDLREKVEGCDFPIIVNSKDGVVTGHADARGLHIKVQDVKGHTTLERDF